MVEVTCKQQKWRRGEQEDATKNTCSIQTGINFQQQEDKTCPSDSEVQYAAHFPDHLERDWLIVNY